MVLFFGGKRMPLRAPAPRAAKATAWTSLRRAEKGASAIEFALLAPMLTLGLLSMVDVGQALTEQVALGSLLRAGAQSAVAGADVAEVKRILDVAAPRNAFSTGGSQAVSLTASLVCACPESPDVPVACSATCAASLPTSTYYDIHGQKTFSGIFLPSFTLSRSLRVQIR